MQLELKTVNKIKIQKINLVNNGLELITVTNNKCLIPLEPSTINDLNKNLHNPFKPKPFIWDFTKELLKKIGSADFIIDNQIFNEYFSYLIIDDEPVPLRISDAYLILSEQNNIYINADLIPKDERNLENELQEAIAAENYILADKLKKEIDRSNT
jgi:bifunctional DNase/RNase